MRLSGASAGAVNAVVLASGHAQALAGGRDPRQGARDALTRLWVSPCQADPVVFTSRRLDAEAVLASNCLPMLFQAIEIDGQACWDGGSADPALAPLIQRCACDALMLGQTNPLLHTAVVQRSRRPHRRRRGDPPARPGPRRIRS